MKSAARVALATVLVLFALTCTGKSPLDAPSASLPLRTLRDVPLSGGASRFDYQSFDPNTGRLYIAHLGDGSMVIFDANKETQVGEVKNLSKVHKLKLNSDEVGHT